MKIYHYDRKTKEFISEGAARRDPLEDRYLIPAYATDIEPSIAGENEVAVFDKDNQEWNIVADYRGQAFWDADRNKHEITEIGVEPDPAWLTEDPGPTDTELAEEFEVKQKNMVSQLRNNASSVIESRFPLYHQVNLQDGTKTDIPDPWNDTRVSDYTVVQQFKQAIINANNSIENDITALSYTANTIADLEAIDISEDAIKSRADY